LKWQSICPNKKIWISHSLHTTISKLTLNHLTPFIFIVYRSFQWMISWKLDNWWTFLQKDLLSTIIKLFREYLIVLKVLNIYRILIKLILMSQCLSSWILILTLQSISILKMLDFIHICLHQTHKLLLECRFQSVMYSRQSPHHLFVKTLSHFHYLREHLVIYLLAFGWHILCQMFWTSNRAPSR